MAIKTDEVVQADEILNMAGRQFKNQAQLIFNADLIGLSPLLELDYLGIARDALSTTTNIDVSSEIQDTPIFSALVMDDFEDNSIDGDIWSTTGSPTETGGQLRFPTFTTANSDQVNGVNFNQDCTIFTRITNSVVNFQLFLRDTTGNAPQLINFPNGTTNLRIDITPGSNNAQVFTNFEGTGGGTPIDITALNDGQDWHLRYTTGGSTDAGRISFVRYLFTSVEDVDFISTSYTSPDTILDAILVVNATVSGSASATYFLSADNGANYEAVTLNEIHRFTNTGTQLRVKIIMSSDDSGNVFQLNHYAVWYNIGATE